MVENKLHFILTSGSTQPIFGRQLLIFPQNLGQAVILPVVAALLYLPQKAKPTLIYVSNLLPCRLADSEYDLAEISFSIGRY